MDLRCTTYLNVKFHEHPCHGKGGKTLTGIAVSFGTLIDSTGIIIIIGPFVNYLDFKFHDDPCHVDKSEC